MFDLHLVCDTGARPKPDGDRNARRTILRSKRLCSNRRRLFGEVYVRTYYYKNYFQSSRPSVYFETKWYRGGSSSQW